MNPLIITILLMQMLGGGEIDLFIPSFPNLEAEFHLSHFAVELLLTINIFTYCICSLIVGSLADRYGSRNTIIAGLVIFTLGSIMCIIAQSYWCLLIGRIVQGAGIAAPSVLGAVLISNHYSIKRHQELLGTINGIVTCGMAFAPVVGSYVNLLYNWQGNFYVLMFFGLICLRLAYQYVPAEKKHLNSSLITTSINYVGLLKSKKLLYYNLIITFVTLPYWVFISMAPILYMEDLGVTLSKFGFYQGSLALIFAGFSFFSSYLIKKFGTRKCMVFSFIMLSCFILLTIIIIFFKLANALIITINMYLLNMGIILPFNILYPLSLNIVPGAKEKISAIISFTKWTSITIILQLISYFYNHSFNIIGWVMIISLILVGFFYYKLMEKGDIVIE